MFADPTSAQRLPAIPLQFIRGTCREKGFVMWSQAMDSPPAHAVVLGNADTELADMRAVMACVRELLWLIPVEQRRLLGDALLNLAVSIKVRESGTDSTAAILVRLIDAVVESDQPPAADDRRTAATRSA